MNQKIDTLQAQLTELEAANQALRARIAQLEEREAHFREFVEGTDDMITQVNGSGHLTYVNSTAARLWGLTRDACIGRSAFAFIHPDDREMTQHAFMGWLQNQERSVSFENRQISLDGKVYPMLWTINLHYHDDGSLAYANSICRNTSQIKQLEADLRQANAELERRVAERTAALQESQQRLQFALEASGDGTWDWNLQTNDAWISDRYREMLGYAPDELPNSLDSWMNNIHPDDLPQVQQALQDYLEGRSPTYALEHRLRHKRDDWRWILTRGKVVLRDEQGAPLRMTGTISDIHERKRVESGLRLFQAITEKAPVGIATATFDGSISYINQSYADMLQYRPAELVGSSFFALYHGSALGAINEVTAHVGEHGFWRGCLEAQRKDGSTLPFDAIVFVVQNEETGPAKIAAIVRDLTAEREAEAERLGLQQQIIDAQRAALRELSTPLIPITDDVMIMPLIGTIDSARALMIMETLLEGVARHQARLVILDITGVAVVDTQVAQAFIQAAQAVQLLGAEVMLTGIQPQIAQTLVALGVDLRGIITRGSLQAGIASALARR